MRLRKGHFHQKFTNFWDAEVVSLIYWIFNIVSFNETTALSLKSPIHHLLQEGIGTQILQSSNSALDTLLEMKTIWATSL